MITRTIILAAISETMLEIIIYAFLAFGALAVLALIAYAVVVFRKLSTAIASMDAAMQSVAGLMDASVPVVTRLHDSVIRVEKLLADRSVGRPPAPATAPAPAPATAPAPADAEQPTQALCACGGAMSAVKATVVEDRPVLTIGCKRCHRTTDVPML